MGQRRLETTVDLIVGMCKAHDGQHRTYTVENPLPDDARIVRVDVDPATYFAAVVLESAEWDESAGAEPGRLEPVVFTVHYLDEDARARVIRERIYELEERREALHAEVRMLQEGQGE